MGKTIHFLIVFFALASGLLMAQNNKLLNSRKTSEYTYVYRLTGKEAEKINKKGAKRIDSTYLHSLVLSYPTDSALTGKLPPGHYLKTFSEKNKQQIHYAYVPDFDVFVLNNNTDLCIQVYALDGKIIPNANVRIGARKLTFDPETQCYTQRKSYRRKGILEVSYRENTAYFQLTGSQRFSRFGWGMRKTLYASPVKYLWKPIDLAARVPGDAINSIRRGWAQGTIADISRFFQKIFSPVQYKNISLHYKGYMVFNKPKYLPGDTVKFKAFLVDKNGKPLNKNVFVALNNYKKHIRLAELSPYRQGAFAHQFFLHDSLDLTLDKSYAVHLEDRDENHYIRASFHYEDYELNHTKLTVDAPTNDQYKGIPFSVFAKGTDDNGLNLMDARLEITALSKNVLRYVNDTVFVPDTLWTHEMDLKPTGKTEIAIPDDRFPKANIEYTLEIRMLTSDNKVFTEQKKIGYYFRKENFRLAAENDSIRVTYLQNGIEKSKEAHLFATDNFGNKTEIGRFATPCKIPLNVYYKTYTAQNGEIEETLDISLEPSLLQCFSNRTSDSLFIRIENPRNLKFTYNMYERNTEKLRGYTRSLAMENRTGSHENYYLSIRYLWGGKIITENYRIPFYDKKLNIHVHQPSLVYPGQKATVEISVTDPKGKPVENVDLTAYALTKKFDYRPPTVPYLEKNRPEKNLINNFNIQAGNKIQKTIRLNYAAWKVPAGLDSIEYYRFLYPGREIYRYECPTNEHVTQFAPFVVSDGEIQPIYAIYVDDLPAYFDWSNENQPYSFRVEADKPHRVKIRLADKSITLNNLTFRQGMKTILSIPGNLQLNNVSVVKEKRTLSKQEKNTLYKYTFPYRNTFQGNLAYIENRGNYYLLSPANHAFGYPHLFAGPVAGKVDFTLLHDYSHTFEHEPNFEYNFSQKTIKMREIKKDGFPAGGYLHPMKNLETRLSDTVLTRRAIEREMSLIIERKRQRQIRYNFPNRTTKGHGSLMVERKYDNGQPAQPPVNTLLLKTDDENFIRIYPGSANKFHELKSGTYKLITFYAGAYYHIADSIPVKTGGTNFSRIRISPENLKKDMFSVKIDSIIDENIRKNRHAEYTKEQELSQIYNIYRSGHTYTGHGTIVQGRITDESGDPIIGASILVKGTNFGTVSDINGFYSLNVPGDKHILAVNYIGFIPYEIDLHRTLSGDAVLNEDTQMLDEVVVTGYGVQKKSSLLGSTTLATEPHFQLMGTVPGVTIRGTGSADLSNQPLVVIDGVIYTGDMNTIDIHSMGEVMILKGGEATSIYGSRGANGVVLISTKGSGPLQNFPTQDDKGAGFDEDFLLAASASASIRANFSDYAFWQPKLITDRNGKASFEVVFPDDITSWETHVLAMDNRKQSGQVSGNIKSYKPVMAQLSLPRFLLPGDTTAIIGKSLNYMPDSTKIATSFSVNGKGVSEKFHTLVNSVIDTLSLVAANDSMTVRYTLKKSDGYFDGEEREIPVFPIGLEETEGNFYVLDKDTTVFPVFNPSASEVTLYADATPFDALNFEVNRLIHYRYACNEQLASKLIGMLSHRLISQYKGEKPEHERDIKRTIEKILQNRNRDGLWGWWKNSGSHYAFSAHIIQSLLMAQKQGFNVNLSKAGIISELTYGLESNRAGSTADAIRIVKTLHLMDSTLLLRRYVRQIDSIKGKSLSEELNLLELKQWMGEPYRLDKLEEARQTSSLGNVFFRDTTTRETLTDSDIQNTLTAYRILRHKEESEAVLNKIRLYLLETKKNNRWWNTYEGAQIIETLLPDLLKESNYREKPQLTVAGSTNRTIDTFPATITLRPNDNISISKKGFAPIYLTTYQRIWNENPKRKNGDFEIQTYFEDHRTQLTQGKNVKLIVELSVKKDADFVMINVPVPAGCSYAEKRQNLPHEVHREYFKNETAIFCEKLTSGKYTFEIELLPRFSGNYTLNPAKAELMYFPVFNANNELRKVRIE